MEQYKGRYIPFPPKKSWKWMKGDLFCQAPKSLIHEKKDPFGVCKFCLIGANSCRDCIYACVNKEQRKAYYEECFPQEKKQIKTEEELPELTATAFHCPDCPQEAELLFVMPDGAVFAFDENVQYLATLELKCKFPGKVERQHKVVAEDPVSNLVKPSELNWDNSYYKYSPSADSYYGLLPGDPDKVAVLGCGTIVRLMPKDAEDVGITEYTPIELIGRSIMVYTSTGIRYDVITGITEAGVIITGTNPGGITQKSFFGHCRFLDGSLPFKVVH